jgi:hypothetical protein
MFHITRPVTTGTLPGSPGVRKQPGTATPMQEPRFGMKTVSFGQTIPQPGPITPLPTQPNTHGARLDYYA